MRAAVVGGGPAGLYAALLLKKRLPGADVVVFERNTAGATYGWGVVFSDRTLTSFREADLETYEQIIDRFIIWDAIDVRYRDRIVRCEGQVFSGISRKALLGLLQARCTELGVRMEFEHEVGSRDELDDFDLVVAADGVRSTVREWHEEAFRPRFAHGSSRYIWFGTTRVFDSFTFIFRSNEDGFFQVHAYPFDGRMSTFIVECAEDVWRAAGLDSAGEPESIAYCRELFAAELRGNDLVSNNSKWISFPTLKNRTWHHGNIVLVGDSAHTAHFSIGSGTKLAMEDSIALVDALAQRADIGPALVEYELERKPRVERFQEAARQSQTYFENTSRYQHMEPLQFAFHLLSRSGRIDYDDLRVRDRHFVGAVDRWFVTRPDELPPTVAVPPAFAPAAIGEMDLPNRIAVAGTDGAPPAAGAGLVLFGPVAVSAHGRVHPTAPGMYSTEHEAAWKATIDSVRASGGARVALTLTHSGPRGSTRAPVRYCDVALDENEGWTPVAASATRYTPRSAPAVELDESRMNDVVDDFADATRSCVQAGCDLIEIDMAQGHLLASFLSPLTNTRTDAHGGSLANRMRFPLRVLDAAKAGTGSLALGVALCADDWTRGGNTLADAVEIARVLKEHGCDVIRVLAGQTVARFHPRFDPYYLTHYADRIRNEVRIATIATGDITTVDHVNTIVAGGRADICLLRPSP